MSTITATVTTNLTLIEQYSSTEVPAAGGQELVMDQFNLTDGLSAASTPPATKAVAREVLLAAPLTLDLTALVRDLGANLDCTGLKLQALYLTNQSATATLTMAPGVSNGYTIPTFTLLPGARVLQTFEDASPDVAAGAKTITISFGAYGADTEVQFVLVFG